MESELPPKEQLAAQAAEGRPITQSEASTIAYYGRLGLLGFQPYQSYSHPYLPTDQPY
ncbi:hypothetical protein L209DRAFT_748046 [Thermothelomyces heterothallicus CBS 203.75]